MSEVPELRVLRYFVAVAEELHFGRAAVRLHISQPALSVQIRKLEHSLGAKLFDRTSRHVELTEVGTVLLEEAHKLLVGADRLVDATRDALRGVRGTLVVGFQGNAAAELTPQILTAFQTRYPRVQVPLAIAWRNDLGAETVSDFVETARLLAALELVPLATTPQPPAVEAPFAATY
ncbi:LysR family transcriptional regulator [Calidifontibacter indicus]|uniref:LysR family transcriptional regulator n=1 Tax=Calidifontibacter indicus TaxID=419650 RepID=UPI003D74CEAF